MEARVLQQMRGESNSFGAATLEDTNEKRTHISEVDAGGFELRGDVFVPTSICCLPYHAFLWRARVQEDVTVESLKLFTVVHPRPEIVVVGLGARGPREAPRASSGVSLQAMRLVSRRRRCGEGSRHWPVVSSVFALDPRWCEDSAEGKAQT